MPGKPLEPRYSPRVTAMLDHMGLDPGWRPLPGTPGSLLLKPVTSPRYEPDLVQVQRATRAQEASEAKARPKIVPMPAEPVYKSTSLPSYVLPDDKARNLDLAHHATQKKQANGENRNPSFIEGCFGPPMVPNTDFTREKLAAQVRSNGNEAAQHRYDPLNLIWFRDKVKK